MRLVIQRVSEASVKIEGQIHASIKKGFLILAGIEETDTEEDLHYLVPKVVNMRIFADADDKMNLDVKQINGDILVVSQFTLYASTKKGNRPSFIKAARPGQAIPLYEKFLAELQLSLGKPCQAGIFGVDMKVALINDGPVTITLDSKNKE